MAKKKVAKKTSAKPKKKAAKAPAKKAARKRGSLTKEAPAKTTKSDKQTRAIIGLIVNVLVFPGVGTIIGGDTRTGVWQLVAFIVSIPLVLVLIGIPLMLAVWVWALISSIKQIQSA